jgi:hypothetical protein
VRRWRVVVLPDAELDVVGHVAYLEEQRAGLGLERFATAVLERVAILRTDAYWPVQQHPELQRRGIRLLPMDRPWDKYGIFFTITDDDEEVHVRAVLHLVRHYVRFLLDR